MPINMTIAIRSAVGAGSRAVNSPADVKAVQTQLNGHMGPSRTRLVVDGKIGPKTIGNIRDFQKAAAGLRNPDGRVDPRGKTEAALNDPASAAKFARMSVGGGGGGAGAGAMPGMPSAAKPGAGANSVTQPELGNSFSSVERQRFNDAWQQAERNQSLSATERNFWLTFLSEMATNEVQTAKLFLAAGGLATEVLKGGAAATNFIKGLAKLKEIGFTVREIVEITGKLAKAKSVAHTFRFIGSLGTSPKLAACLKGLGRVAVVVTFTVTAIEVSDCFAKGQWGKGTAEIWKFGVTTRFPLLAIMDAISTLLEDHYKGKNASREFKFIYGALRHCNPVAMQAVAVDSVVSTVEIVIKSIHMGELDQASLQKLVNRIEDGPLEVFTMIGKDLGDVSYDGYKYVEAGVEKVAADFGAWCVEMDLI